MIKLIAGLRNPGSQYEHTRHNAGAWFIDKLAQDFSIKFQMEKSLQAEMGLLCMEGSTCRVILPTTFMNHSGMSIRAVSQFYRILPEEILAVHDELDLPVGSIRLKSGGGHGGHNGLKDMVSQLGSSAFHRLRVGIGHPGHQDGVVNYVLGKPSSEDKRKILDSFDKVMDWMPDILTGNISAAMNQINR